MEVCTVAGAVMQEALSKRTWPDSCSFMELLPPDIFTVLHFFLGVKYGILSCLNCNIAFTLVINPSCVPAMGLQSALRLNPHFHLN